MGFARKSGNLEMRLQARAEQAGKALSLHQASCLQTDRVTVNSI